MMRWVMTAALLLGLAGCAQGPVAARDCSALPAAGTAPGTAARFDACQRANVDRRERNGAVLAITDLVIGAATGDQSIMWGWFYP